MQKNNDPIAIPDLPPASPRQRRRLSWKFWSILIGLIVVAEVARNLLSHSGETSPSQQQGSEVSQDDPAKTKTATSSRSQRGGDILDPVKQKYICDAEH
ncbi:MAG: hypothetical protein IIA67_11925, partial [Planctomycetes bacterium]|nr:hypothetical protein [Planctomycetota bacterium]